MLDRINRMVTKYQVLVSSNIYNPKQHELLNVQFRNHKDYTIHKNTGLNYIKAFIIENRSNPDMVVILYFFIQRRPNTAPVLDLVNSFDPEEFKLRVVYLLTISGIGLTISGMGLVTRVTMLTPPDPLVARTIML